MCVCVGTQYALKIKSKWDHAKHTVLQLKFLDLSQNIPISADGVSLFFSMVGKDSMFYGCTTIQSVSIKEHLNCFHILAQCCRVHPCAYNCSVSQLQSIYKELAGHQVYAHFSVYCQIVFQKAPAYILHQQCLREHSFPKSHQH